ncbi:DUF4134 domain-containing protein [Puia dinghuensis]|uniref:DUF4134 domain-containing protein n=1 Tax=Puia dinghuensis TaxID=1792502 RepID=A0A8J2XS86_9BACT|nr:DUF4134 domain-containing protein [Puia dinghuensis]GGA93002.1 hypothetical protein GCM10011511_15510 [Puia dinghuensis]
MKKKHTCPSRRCLKSIAITSSVILFSTMSEKASAQAGNGVAGLQQANTLVGSYFDYGVTLLYSIGAIVGLVGAVKVYNAWSHGDQQTNKLAASWFGACIFLVVVAALLKSFFGVS